MSQDNLSVQTSNNLFLGTPPPNIQKPNLDYLDILTHAAPANRITDLIDAKFYDGYIKAGDLSSIVAEGSAMYTLSRPGRYYIAGDIAVSPTNNNVTAIRITASNVLLDLNRATISQASSSTATGLIGIELGTSSTSVANIIIQNGRIDSFSGTGININSGCANLILRDLITSRSAVYGININTSSTIYLTNIQAISGYSATSSVTGLNLYGCNNVLIQDSDFSNNSSDASTSTGIRIDISQQCVLDNCTANNNNNIDSRGIWFQQSSNCWCKNCHASYNNGTINNSFGFLLTSICTRLRFTNCSAYGQINGTIAAGFYFDETTKYSIIEDSYSYGNGSSLATGAYGIYFGDGATAGPTQCIVRNCQIYDNFGATLSYGFKDFATTSSTILAHNVVSGNGAINPGSGNITPTDSNNANYYILYSQSPDVHSTSNLFMEANLTAIGAINNTGILGEFQNLSIVQ